MVYTNLVYHKHARSEKCAFVNIIKAVIYIFFIIRTMQKIAMLFFLWPSLMKKHVSFLMKIVHFFPSCSQLMIIFYLVKLGDDDD